MALPSKRKGFTLWLGGSSSLARTYVNQFGSKGLVLCGLEPEAPKWIRGQGISYVQIDLANLTDDESLIFFEQFSANITSIVVGVRPLLFAPYIDKLHSERMVKGIQKFLCHACAELEDLEFVLHISSVAIADHLRSQHFMSETDPHPPLSECKASYDIFKRRSEEEITGICGQYQIPFCNLRLSAILSDDVSCIQCSAMNLQGRIGCYFRHPLDFNSSVNVSRAIDLIISRSEMIGDEIDSENDTDETLDRSSPKAIQQVYYYTRPLLLPRPVPLGYYLEEFRKAYQLEYTSVWIPCWIVAWLIAFFHWFASATSPALKSNQQRSHPIPYVEAVDYLLQVGSREHSFDCSRFAADFPELEEETIRECLNSAGQ